MAACSSEIVAGCAASSGTFMKAFPRTVGIWPSARSRCGADGGSLRHVHRFAASSAPSCSTSSRCGLSSTETDLEIYNLFGTVSVIVPDGVQVSVAPGGLFASHVIDIPARSSLPTGPRLGINARGPGGTLYVRNPREPRERRGRFLDAGDTD
jgi:hypothetical protein